MQKVKVIDRGGKLTEEIRSGTDHYLSAELLIDGIGIYSLKMDNSRKVGHDLEYTTELSYITNEHGWKRSLTFQKPKMHFFEDIEGAFYNISR